MKKYFLLFAVCIASIAASAQTEEADTTLSPELSKVLNACLALSDAASHNDKAAIKQAANSLKDCNTADFTSLRCKDDSITSVNGHLVFDEAFADSLAEGKDAYKHAEDITRNGATRGQDPEGGIYTKTCTVKAGKSTTYSFGSRGHQELAVAAEAGGRVTMKIHVTNNAGFDKRFDDTKDVKPGRNFRKAVFDLPKDKRNTVTLEVINCGKKDISFVVISN